MSAVKIILVGTGDAASSGGKAHQAIWIEFQNKSLLIDCGPTTLYKLKQLNLDLNKLQGILFTHFHGDHFGGFVQVDLCITLEYKRKQCFLYGGPRGLSERISQLSQMFYSRFYPNNQFERNIQEYEENNCYTILDDYVKISTIKMVHSPESIAYKIEIAGKTIAITGDTQWHDGIIELAKDSDVLICECFHYKEREQKIGHCSYEEILRNKNLLKTQRIILTHPSQELLDHKDVLELELAEDGMIISL